MSEDAAAVKRIEILVKKEWCKSCVICVSICPKSVLEMQGPVPVPVRIEDCTACLLCEIHCPDFAIRVVDDKRRNAQVRTV